MWFAAVLTAAGARRACRGSARAGGVRAATVKPSASAIHACGRRGPSETGQFRKAASPSADQGGQVTYQSPTRPTATSPPRQAQTSPEDPVLL